MASAFNLTAEINLRGPANLRKVVSDIRRQLGSISVDINPRISPAASRNISDLSSRLQRLNSILSQTRISAENAANGIRSLSAAVSSVRRDSDTLARGFDNAGRASQTLNQQTRTTTRDLIDAGDAMTNFGRQSALAVRRFAAFSIVTNVIFGFIGALNKGVKAFIDFDREFIRLQQVTGESSDGLRRLGSTITSLSTTLGVASAELTTVSVTLAQAGLTAIQTEKALTALAKAALAPTFSDLNSTVEGSIALIRQFGIDANDLESALGSINAVASKFAVEAGDIISAIQRTGGVFASASKGVSEGTDALNEFIAVFTSVRATTRESAETIATGLRTIFTRVQRGRTIDALKEFGVNLTDLEGKFVGPFEAIRRLSEGLSKLDPRDLRFSEIVEELGGFRQIGKVIPLIQQFAVSQQALKVAQQGTGSLAKDAATAQNALAVQIAKVREEFTALIRSIGQSEGFRSFVKLSLDLASALIKLADAAKVVLPALAAIATVRGLSALTRFSSGFAGSLRPTAPTPRAFASGGLVPGSGNRDSVDARLMPGEFVLKKDSVKEIGIENLKQMNTGGKAGLLKAIGRKPSKFQFGGQARTFGVAALFPVDEGVPDSESEISVADIRERLASRSKSTETQIQRLGVSEANKPINKFLGFGETASGAVVRTKVISDSVNNEEASSFLKNDVQKSIGELIDRSAATLGKALGFNPIGTASQDIINSVGTASTLGSVFEGALALLGAPQPVGKGEQDPFDFPFGLGQLSGNADKAFGKLVNMPVDAKLTASSDIAKEVGTRKVKNYFVDEIKKSAEWQDFLNKQPTDSPISGIESTILASKFSSKLRPNATYSVTDLQAELGPGIIRTDNINDFVGPGKPLEVVRGQVGQRGAKYRLTKTEGRASGGQLTQSVDALLTPGEAVIGPDTAKSIGYAKLNRMNQADKNNAQGFSGGGDVSIVPGTGNTDSFGPVPLPVGSYVIRKKATEALGFNRGGGVGVSKINKFNLGGRAKDFLDASGIDLSRKDAAALQKAYQKAEKSFGLLLTDVESLPLDEARAAITAWVRAINQGASEIEATVRAQEASSSQFAKAGSPTPGSIQEKNKRDREIEATARRNDRADRTSQEGFNRLSEDQQRAVLASQTSTIGQSETRSQGSVGKIDFSVPGDAVVRAAEELSQFGTESAAAKKGLLVFNTTFRQIGNESIALKEAIAAATEARREENDLVKKNLQSIDENKSILEKTFPSFIGLGQSTARLQQKTEKFAQEFVNNNPKLASLGKSVAVASKSLTGLKGIATLVAGGAALSSASKALGGPETTAGAAVGAAGDALNFATIGSQIGTALTPLISLIPVVGPLIAPFAGAIGGAVGALFGFVKGLNNAEEEAKKLAIEQSKIKLEKTVEQTSKEVARFTAKPTSSGLSAAISAVQTTAAAERSSREIQKPTSVEDIIKLEQAGAQQALDILTAALSDSSKTFAKLAEDLTPEQLKTLKDNIVEADQEYIKEQQFYAKRIAELRSSGDFAAADSVEKEKNAKIQALGDAIFQRTTQELDAKNRAAVLAKQQEAALVALNKAVSSLARSLSTIDQALNKAAFSIEDTAKRREEIISGQQSLSGNRSTERLINILQNPQASTERERREAAQAAQPVLGQDLTKKLSDLSELPITAANVATRLANEAGEFIAKEGGTEEELRQAQIEGAAKGLRQQVEGLVPENLAGPIFESIQAAVDKAADSKGPFDIDKFIADALGGAGEEAKKAQEILIKSLELTNQAFNEVAETAKAYADLQSKIISRQANLAQIQGESRLKETEALGIKTTPEQRSTARLAGSISNLSQAVNTLDTTEFFRAPSFRSGTDINARNISQARSALIRERDLLGGRQAQLRDRAAGGDQEAARQLIQTTNQLANLNNAIKATEDELENLPQNLEAAIGDVIGQIQERVQQLEQRKEAGAGFAEKLVTSTPKELAELNNTYKLLNNSLRGNVTTINQSQSAQQAYVNALRSGQSRQEAATAAQQAFADSNKQALSLFDEFAKIAGVEGREFDLMRADLIENFAKSTGQQDNQFIQAALRQLREDPAKRAENDPVLIALKKQAESLREEQVKAVNDANKLDREKQAELLQSVSNIIIQKFQEVANLISQSLDSLASATGTSSFASSGQAGNAPGRGGANAVEGRREREEQQARADRAKADAQIAQGLNRPDPPNPFEEPVAGRVINNAVAEGTEAGIRRSGIRGGDASASSNVNINAGLGAAGPLPGLANFGEDLEAERARLKQEIRQITARFGNNARNILDQLEQGDLEDLARRDRIGAGDARQVANRQRRIEEIDVAANRVGPQELRDIGRRRLREDRQIELARRREELELRPDTRLGEANRRRQDAQLRAAGFDPNQVRRDREALLRRQQQQQQQQAGGQPAPGQPAPQQGAGLGGPRVAEVAANIDSRQIDPITQMGIEATRQGSIYTHDIHVVAAIEKLHQALSDNRPQVSTPSSAFETNNQSQNISQEIQSFVSSLSVEIGNFGSYVDKLASINIPDRIEMVGTHTVEVNIVGGAAFAGLEEGVRKLVISEINNKMSEIWRDTGGELGPRPA
jgi:hypothetical protein